MKPTKTVTLRIAAPKHERLASLAKARGMSLNKLLDELATIALANHDAAVRFEARAARGDRRRGLELLDKIDRALGSAHVR